jgi:outer membrane protein OmpA-like peptidoglycan-associated protein
VRNFNRVFLSITLLLGTVFAGAVLPTQAGAVGFAPVGALEGQNMVETSIPGGFNMSVDWTPSSVSSGDTGTWFIQLESAPASGVFETATPAATLGLPGFCTVDGSGACSTDFPFFGVPNIPAYSAANEARYKISLRVGNRIIWSGEEFTIHTDVSHLTDTYVSIDESSTIYGQEIKLAGFVLAETESVSVDTGTIYFYDTGDALFTDSTPSEAIVDSSTAIGSCTPQPANETGTIGVGNFAYPHHWSGGCSITISNDGTNGKFHTGNHTIIAKYVDYTGGLTKRFASSWSNETRNFAFDNYWELAYADLTVEQASLDFDPGDPSNITYGDAVPSYTYFLAPDTMTSTGKVSGYGYGEDDPRVFNEAGTGWSYINLPTCTSDYGQNSQDGAVGVYPILCETSTATNYDYTFGGVIDNPTLTVDLKTLYVIPESNTVEYGESAPEYLRHFNGFVYGETESVLNDPVPVCEASYDVGTDAGQIEITCNGDGTNGNYDILTSDTATLTITQAPLDIYAPLFGYDGNPISDGVDYAGADANVDYSAYTVVYADPALDLTQLEDDTVFVGFKNSETGTVLSGDFACSSDYNNLTHVADSVGALINCGQELSSVNYAITLHEGSYLVNQAPLYVNSISNITVPKGSLDVFYPYNIEGFLNGDSQFNIDYTDPSLIGYTPPTCTSSYTPETGQRAVLPITCGGLISNDYYGVYETGTAVTVQAPAAFPTTTNLTSSTYSTTKGGTLSLYVMVCSGVNAHPLIETGLCPGSAGLFSTPTPLPSSIVGFYFNGQIISEAPYCLLLGNIFNDCSYDMTIPTDIETGTYEVQAVYGGTNQWGYSTETISVEVTAVPMTAWPVDITYRLNTGAESMTAFTETHTAVATWTPMSPAAMSASFIAMTSTHTFNYWQTLGGTETYTVGGAALANTDGAFNGKVLYGNWTIKSSGGGGGGYVPPANVVATVSVTGPTYTYDAAPHGASATTNPAGLAVTVTYNGSTTPPTNAGTYTVVATVTASGYTGTASSTLVINKATPTIIWSSPAAVDEGTALSGAQLNAAGSIPGTLSYSPSAGFVPGAGTAGLSVTFTPTDSANWNNASKSVSLTVNAKAVVTPEPTPDPKPAPKVKNLVLGFSLSSAKISKADLAKIANASLDNPEAVITIVGYAQPSGNKAADLKLSRARANAVKAQILALNPDAVIKIVAKGSTINKTCKKTLNKCAIVSVA